MRSRLSACRFRISPTLRTQAQPGCQDRLQLYAFLKDANLTQIADHTYSRTAHHQRGLNEAGQQHGVALDEVVCGARSHQFRE